MSFALRLRLDRAPSAVLPDGREEPLAPHDAALLAWLALEGATPRARLASLLWPDKDAEAARNSLRQRLFKLRRQFGAAVVEGQALLTLAAGIDHDLARSEPLLDGLPLQIEGEFAHWLQRQRHQRQTQRSQALMDRCEAAERSGDLEAALAAADALVALDPLSEEAHRRVVRLHYQRGDRAAALLAFDRCEQMLKHEVGARPSRATLDLLAAIEAAQPGPAAPPQRVDLPVAILRPPRLIGREAQRAALEEAWSTERVAVVSGEAGMGKSRLIGDFAAERGRVLVVSARPGDAGIPFATASRLLRGVPGEIAERIDAGTREEISRLLPDWGTGPTPTTRTDRVRLFNAVARVLQATAGALDGIVVDDLHAADGSTIELLQFVLPGGPQRWALAMRPAEVPPVASRWLAQLQSQAALVPVELTPLSAEQTAQLIDSLGLPGVAGAADATGLQKRTGGNPLFLLESLKLAWRADAGGVVALAPAALPASVGQVIERRLGRLSADAMSLARLAALAGPDFGIELAEALLHTPALRLADAWQELEQAQVLRGTAFAHDLVFAAVLRFVPQAIARHTHRALATWLAAHGGVSERIAEHWLAADEPRQAVAPLLAAARHSVALGVNGQASAQFERAAVLARELELAGAEFEALEGLHGCYVLDDPGAAHEALLERLGQLASTPRERLVARVCRHDTHNRRMGRVDLAALRADLAEAEAMGDEELIEDLVQTEVGECVRRGEPDQALSLLQRHEAMLVRRQSPLSRAELLGNVAAVLANLDRLAEADAQLRAAYELFVQTRDWAGAMVILANRTRLMRAQGRSAVLEWIDQMDRAHALHGANWRSWLQSRVATAESWREAGRYADALQALQLEPERMRRALGDLAPARPVVEALIWLDLGQHARAARALDTVTAAEFAASPPWLQARLRLLQARVVARVASEGEAEVPNERSWALLNEAGSLAPRSSRRNVWFEIVLQRAAWSDPDAGAALAEGVVANALAQGMLGFARRAWLQACACELRGGRLAAAQRCADEAQALASHVFDPAVGAEPVVVSGMAGWWAAAVERRLAAAHGACVEAGQDALQALALEQVPPPYRDSFLHRNPDWRALG